jgi:hypothetical protein
MNSLYDAMLGLAPNQDTELINGYQRYAALIATILTPQQVETYAEYIQRSGTIRVFEELTPEEFAELTVQENVIATTVIADEDASMENRRVAALLNQRGQHEAAPDLETIGEIRH